MPDMTSYISILTPAAMREGEIARDNDRILEIEALEVANFELRNQITRLKVHNATLGRMLMHRSRTPLERPNRRSTASAPLRRGPEEI
jgi:hypothetical protein